MSSEDEEDNEKAPADNGLSSWEVASASNSLAISEDEYKAVYG